MSNPVRWILTVLGSLVDASDPNEERSLHDGSEWIGELNHRTGQMDCGQDPGGLYEDDL